jgi:hypothetical protein
MECFLMLAVIQVGIDQNMISEREFIELFRYELYLIPVGYANRYDFETYIRVVGRLRSSLIRDLRVHGVKGNIRARYNDSLEYLIPNYKKYLYKIDNKCKLCGFIIYDIRYATIDL